MTVTDMHRKYIHGGYRESCETCRQFATCAVIIVEAMLALVRS